MKSVLNHQKSWLLLVSMCLIFSSCMKDTFVATTSVKKCTLLSLEYDEACDGSTNSNKVKIYEDFNVKFSLALYDGCLCVLRYDRDNSTGWNLYATVNGAGIVTVGKCDSISDITSGCALGAGFYFSDSFYYPISCHKADIQPNYGYSAVVSSDDNEIQIRIRIIGYSLRESGAIDSIRIEYQLW